MSPGVRGQGQGDPSGARLSVAMVSPGWPPEMVPNGIVPYVGAIADNFRASGHRVSILAHVVKAGEDDPEVYDLRRNFSESGPAGRALRKLARRVSPKRFGYWQSCHTLAAAARRAIAEHGVQLIEMEESFGWPYLVKRWLPIPVVVRLHGPWFLNAPALGVAQDAEYRRRVVIEGRAIAAADAVTAPSLDVLEQTRAYYGLELAGAEVIPPPFPWPPPSAAWGAEGCTPGLILFVGRFDRHKGADVLLDAFGLVAGRHPGARLQFVGPDKGIVDDDGRSWSIGDYLRERLPGLAESGRAQFLGQRPATELPGLRQRAALTVVASRYETFCLTMAEAMVQGCPLVATRAGAIPEQVRDGENGLLCRPDDAEGMAGAIGRLLDDPALAARLGRRAAEDCAARLDPGTLADRMAEIYRRTIAERGGRARA